MARGLLDQELADHYTLFLATEDITYCLYKDSDRILGNTFSMCILQVLMSASFFGILQKCIIDCNLMLHFAMGELLNFCLFSSFVFV